MFSEFGSFAFAWYNVPFTFLLGLCLLLAAFQLVGLGMDHDADADFDADADLDAEADVDADADADSDADGDGDAESDGLSPLTVLAFVGRGRNAEDAGGGSFARCDAAARGLRGPC